MNLVDGLRNAESVTVSPGGQSVYVAGNGDDAVAVFSREDLPRYLLAFWHAYRYTRSAELPADGLLRRSMIPDGTAYAVVFGERRLDFRPFREDHRAGCSVLVLTDRVDVLRDFSGVYHDAPGWTWTGRTFSYFPDGRFRSLVLVLNGRRPYYARTMSVKTERWTRSIRLGAEETTIELIRASEEEKEDQLARLLDFQSRHAEAAPAAIARLKEVAIAGGNIFDALMDAVQVLSLGQISRALFEVGGQYRRSM